MQSIKLIIVHVMVYFFIRENFQFARQQIREYYPKNKFFPNLNDPKNVLKPLLGQHFNELCIVIVSDILCTWWLISLYTDPRSDSIYRQKTGGST